MDRILFRTPIISRLMFVLALAIALCLLSVASFAQAATVVSASTGMDWTPIVQALFGTVLSGIAAFATYMLKQHQSKSLVLGALERAAGYGIAQAQQQQLDMSKPATWDVMVRQAGSYMLSNFGPTLRALGATGSVEGWVTAALGKVLGTGAAPTALIGAATQLVQGEAGSMATDLTDTAVGTVASAVASKVQGAMPDADAIADKVIAKLPVGLQVVAQSGKTVAEASVSDLLGELTSRTAPPAPPLQAAAAQPAAAAA